MGEKSKKNVDVEKGEWMGRKGIREEREKNREKGRMERRKSWMTERVRG